jgi:hypothetical protein
VSNLNLNYIYGDGNSNTLETGIELMSEASSLTVKTTGGLQLKSSVSIKQNLVFSNGKIFSEETNFVTLKSTASASNLSDSRYNEGPFAIETTSTLEYAFPMGSNGKYRPIGIIPTSSSPSVFKSSYFNYNYTSAEHTSDLKEISNKEWWNVERISGNADARVKLNWNTESGINEANVADLRVARFDGTLWQNEGVEFSEGESFIISDELEDFGPFTFGGVNETVFPVVFYSFEGESREGVSVLKWKTALEHNNSGFAVEKSEDGVFFKEIGFIEPSRNNAEIKTYEYKDYTFISSSYYRIRQVDYDGRFLYSKIIYLESKPSDIFFIKPNPSKGSITLVAGGVPDEVYQVNVNSIEGVNLAIFKGDLKQLNLELNNLLSKSPEGIYVIAIRTKEKVESIKFFKQ